MTTAFAAIQEQNRLLVEQNRLLAEQNQLLREVASIENHTKTGEETAGMMTEWDLQLILMSDNILGAIDRWNESRGHRRGSRKKVTPQQAP